MSTKNTIFADTKKDLTFSKVTYCNEGENLIQATKRAFGPLADVRFYGYEGTENQVIGYVSTGKGQPYQVFEADSARSVMVMF